MVKIKKVVMKLLGLCLLLLAVVSCQQDDLRDYEHKNEQIIDVKQGRTTVVNQQELMNRYVGNNLAVILKNGFEQESKIQTTMSSSEIPVYIDLDHIQVFESAKMHAITYRVVIGDEAKDANGKPEMVYNLMYYSHDYKDYYVTLFRYDFTTISFERFIQDPKLTLEVLGFIPLNDIEDIYENIAYSYLQGLRSTSSTTGVRSMNNNHVSMLDDCIDVEIVIDHCSGPAKHLYGDDECTKEGNDRAKPTYVVLSFSDCFDSPVFGGGPTGHPYGPISGSPGGGGGGGSNPTNPIKGIPIKKGGDFVAIGDTFSQINIGNPNQNVKTLKAISRDIKNDLKTFNTNPLL